MAQINKDILLKSQYFYRGGHISLSWFSCGSSILVELEFGDVGFCGGRKTGEPEEKPSEQDANQQQTEPNYGTGSESNPGHIRGRRMLSPLLHPCSSIHTDLVIFLWIIYFLIEIILLVDMIMSTYLVRQSLKRCNLKVMFKLPCSL